MDSGAEYYRRYLGGDDDSFTLIVREYRDGLILYLDSFVRNISAAEELAEDTFVKLGIKRPKFKGNSAFRTWLYSVGRNLAIDYLRKQSKHTSVPIDTLNDQAELELLEKAYIRKEEKCLIHKAMSTLRTEYRQVLWLIYFEGFSIKEAAAVMNKSVHNTETLAYRARKSLRKELEMEGFEYEDI